MKKNIALIWGDCSSPEIVTQAVRVMDKIAEKYGHEFTYTDVAMGGEAIDKYGEPLPAAELEKCKASDSVLLGAIGGPKWDGVPVAIRPEKGLLALRSGMGLYTNIRPSKIWPQLAGASPLKESIVAKGIDIMIVRELTGGIYFGSHETFEENGEKKSVDKMEYTEHEIERCGRVAFESAMKRRKKVCSVDKANVLDTSRLWRATMEKLAKEYPEVEYSNMLVDNCAMQLVKDPSQFDVLVTSPYAFRPGIHASMSNLRYAGPPRSPVAVSTTWYGILRSSKISRSIPRSSAWNDSLCSGRQKTNISTLENW